MGYQPVYKICGGKGNNVINMLPLTPPTSGSVIVYPNKESYTNNLPTNCVNCGAPLHSCHCEYCDTNY